MLRKSSNKAITPPTDNKRKIKNIFEKWLSDPKNFPIEWIKKSAAQNIDKNYADHSTSIRSYAPSLAATHNRIDVLNWLVDEMDCSLNIKPLVFHPLIAAIKAKQYDALDWLIDHTAEEGIEGYCIEACIRYDNLAALDYLLADDDFPCSLAENSFEDSKDNKMTTQENVTSLIIKFQRFDMLIWMLQNQEDIFWYDIIDNTEITLPLLYAYFQELQLPQLQIFLNEFICALSKLEVYDCEIATNIIDEHSTAAGRKEKIANSFKLFPTVAPDPVVTPHSASPKKHSHFNLEEFGEIATHTSFANGPYPHNL